MIFRGFKVTGGKREEIYTRAQKTLERAGYNPEEHEEFLCQQNPLYHLLFDPFREYKTSKGNVVAYIDRVLGTAIDIVIIHVGTLICAEPLVAHALKYIRDPTIRDKRVKTLALFFFMWQQMDVVEFFRSLYPPNSKSLEYFNEIVYMIIDAAKLTLHTGFSCYNIKTIIDEFYETLLNIFSSVPVV